MQTNESVSSRPDLVIVFRHCEKLDPCKKGGTSSFPECCDNDNLPPNSCSDCSPQGYTRSLGLHESMTNLLEKIAPGRQLTHIYAASSKEIDSKCSKSRRMWELVVPLSAATQLPIDTDYCATDQEAVAKDILSKPSGSYVAVSWEHGNIPGLIGWIMALATQSTAATPLKVAKWHGAVFDQYWIVDLRSGTPKMLIEPQNILPTDCPYARDSKGKCPSSPSPNISVENFTAMTGPNSVSIGAPTVTIFIVVVVLSLGYTYINKYYPVSKIKTIYAYVAIAVVVVLTVLSMPATNKFIV